MTESLGEHFKKARQAKGFTLEEAASRTRILPQYLKAVEENNYARLPDEVFAKGFVRSYSRVLGLEEEAVVRMFDESAGVFYAKRAEREHLKRKMQEEARRKKINRNIVIGMVGVSLVALFVLIGQDREGTSPPPAQKTSKPAPPPVPEPVAPPPAPPKPAAEVPPSASVGPTEVERNVSGVLPLEGVVPGPKKLILDIEALERSWVMVQADTSPPQDVMLYPGERVRWTARERFTVTLGNAGGVRVSLNGNEQGPYGTSGMVVKDIVFTH
jgi:transcriptional regulator with XRE-family HTH domain